MLSGATAKRALSDGNATLVLVTDGHVMPDTENRTRGAVDDGWGSAIPVPSEQSATH